MALREILASFGIDVDTKNLDKGKKEVDGFSHTVKNLGEALLGGEIARGFKELVGGAIELGSSINDTADKLGLSTHELQEFQFAGKLAGVSSEEMATSLGFLNKNLGLAATGNEEAAKNFGSLGISIKDSSGHVKAATDVALELADKLGSMGSQAERTAAITKVMGRAGADLLPLFHDGSKGLQEAFDKFHDLGLEIDENFIKAADDAGDQLDTLKLQFSVLKTKLVAEALPVIKDVTEFLLKMGAGVGALVKNTNLGKVAMVAMAAVAAGALFAALNGLAKSLGIVDGLMGLLDAEVLLPVAAFVLLALALEDVYTLFTGGKSVIGDFIDSMFGVGASKVFVEEVKNEAKELWKQFLELWPTIQKLGAQFSQLWGELGGGSTVFAFLKGTAISWGVGLQAIAGTIQVIITTLGILFSFWEKGVSVWKTVITEIRLEFEKVVAVVNKILDAASHIPGLGSLGGSKAPAAGGGAAGLGSTVASAGGGLFGAVTSVLPAALGGGGGAQGNNQVSQDNKVTINVNGTDQPASTAGKIQSALSDTFETQKRNAINALGSLFS